MKIRSVLFIFSTILVSGNNIAASVDVGILVIKNKKKSIFVTLL